ncbi:acyl-CoA thioesterase [Williamsia sp. Leaf354]|uniref:acyl-CoA thioesterase n=1 Tax=Williamsia sp. Leaf354 TaxID=1736349 RepID=UPI000ACF7C04|nr:thioesterase family protein [Williamsia sp. Leaf354]
MLEPDAFAFEAAVGVRWSDADSTGAINDARLVTLMEEARVAWLLSAGAEYRPLITSAMIVTVGVRFHRRLTHRDGPLRIGMWIDRYRSVDFVIGYEIGAADDPAGSTPACTATTQMAVVDIENHTLRRLTAEEKGHLSTWSRPA